MRLYFNIADQKGFVKSCEVLFQNVGRGSKMATQSAVRDVLGAALQDVPVDTGTLAASIYGGVERRSDVRGYFYKGLVGFGAPQGMGASNTSPAVTRETRVTGSKTTLGGFSAGQGAGVHGDTKGAGAGTWASKQSSTTTSTLGSVKVSREGSWAPGPNTTSYGGHGGYEWIIPPSNPINPKSNLPASAYAARVHEDLDMAHPNGGKAKFLEDAARNYAAANFKRTAMEYWRIAIISTEAQAKEQKSSLSGTMRGWFKGLSAEQKAAVNASRGQLRPNTAYTWNSGGTSTQYGGVNIYKGSEYK